MQEVLRTAIIRLESWTWTIPSRECNHSNKKLSTKRSVITYGVSREPSSRVESVLHRRELHSLQDLSHHMMAIRLGTRSRAEQLHLQLIIGLRFRGEELSKAHHDRYGQNLPLHHDEWNICFYKRVIAKMRAADKLQTKNDLRIFTSPPG